MGRNFVEEGGRSYDIFIIDSDHESVSYLVEFFEKRNVVNTVTVANSSDEAYDFLNQQGKYRDSPQPDLVFLDPHLPDTSGLRILTEVKDHAGLQDTPVIVLTTSEEAEMIKQTYQLGANAYVRKPDSPEQYEQVARAIEEFWLKHVHLPPKIN